MAYPVKRAALCLASLLVILGLATSSAFAAGTIPLSMTQQFDTLGKPLGGGRLFLIQAGTVGAPQNCFQDTGLTIPWPNPITLDAAGRVPQLFCADGSIKVRLTDKNGVQQLVADDVLVIGPSSGGGGGGSVDQTSLLQTGQIIDMYATGIVSGFVRCNGRSIGGPTSGATERANGDTQALFNFLWQQDPNLAVSGGRGASSSADYAANKILTLPDCKGRVRAGLDDMGATAAGRLTSTYFGASATVLGASGGTESKTLITANLPPYTPAGTLSISNGAITINGQSQLIVSGSGSGVGGGGAFGVSGAPLSASQAASTGILVGTAQGGTSTPHAIVQPTLLVTTYIRL
ncbi:hypothetical protein [Bradyrhizobium sp. I1.7.5]|uniref:hypothetical protein n=1 Tax=Bradyrhizobium sp. I1.7.5 TaxID=3156363 RepID=UPI0033972D3B